MELLAPAGNVEKLAYAYAYGADAAYIGLKKFSLRVKADNFYEDEYKKVIELKNKYPGKRLHCALNISFHDEEIDALKQNLDYFKQYPIDAFIVQDIGVVPLLQKEFPNAELHLSTQASCVNSEAVKMYKQLGFKRIVLGREISLNQIKRIKDSVPDMELEAFGHGAMCIAYAGRCLMSAYLTGRSAQSGFCSHTCRWNFKLSTDQGDGSPVSKIITPEEAKAIAQSGNLLIEEEQRKGEYFPIYEGDDFTAVLSSKDLRMIEHLKDFKAAGVDSLKIEGRMKSIYYVAMVTRAYRYAIDMLEGKISEEEAAPFIASLQEVPHRETTTGFYYGRARADETTVSASDSPYELAGTIEKKFTSEEEDKIFANGAALEKARKDEIEAMHPNMRAEVEKDLEQNPEKQVLGCKKIPGYKLYQYNSLNKTTKGTELELVSPDVLSKTLSGKDYIFVNSKNGTVLSWVNPDHDCAIYTNADISEGTLVRTKDEGFVEGQVRTSGR